MARLIPAALIASVIALVLIAGLVDSVIGGEWDHFAVFLIALGLVIFLIARTRRSRPTVTLRKDLTRWVTDYSNRTGQTVEVTIDRAVAGHRRRVAPAEGHTALLGTTDGTGDAKGSRETRAKASTANSDDDDESVCVVLDGTGFQTSVAGGKGAALDRLIAINIPTPATGVITTGAYRRFVSDSDLEVWLDDLASAGVPEPSRMDEVAAAVDERFLAAPMAPDLENVILDLARTIRGDDGRLAVRSSATAEDQDAASFAGQYTSFLEIEDDASVLRSVRLVWASLWHPAPLAYREHRGIGHDVAMAVVVMRLVEAEHAGVLFTIDPGGEADHLRIEHVPGLAEGLVSGAVTPEAVVVPRSGPIPEHEDGPPLGDVVALALRVEEAFDGPQDIEWAYDGDRLYLVQARPITTQAERAPDDDGFDVVTTDGSTYTSAGIGEMLPGVLPPLLWSIDGPLIEQGFRQLFSELGVLPESDETGSVVGRFRGRAALNLDLLKEAAAAMPGGTAAEMERQYFGEVVSEDIDETPPSGGLINRARELALAGKSLAMRRGLGSEGAVVIAAVERVLAIGVDPQELNDPHLLAYWRSIRALAERVVASQVAVAAAAAAAYRGLEMFLEPHLDDAANAAQRLTAGGIEACGLKTSLDVCDLVQEGLGIDDVRIALEAADDPDTMRALLSGSEEGRQFIAAFRERLDRAGSAAIFAGPTWGEETAGAWNLLRQAAIVVLGARRPEMAADREEVLDEVIAEMTSGKKWKVTRVLTGQIIDVRVRMLRRLVAEAVEFLQLRETTKLAVLRLGGDARRTVRTIAQRLAESGVIENEADADLLDVEELEAAFSGTPISRAVLDRRRRALETARLVGPLPRLFSGRPDRVEVAVVADGDMVTGWAASPGLHRGRVRIITDIAATSSLEPGDVLVARATDPSWTPLFLTAGALRVEEGGPLSHAAIVARELGLPAVLNIEGITGLLVDGEEVTVDGTAGRILLHRSENVEMAA